MTTTCARSGKLVCTTFSGLTIVVAMPVDKAIDELIDVVPELRGERVVTELAGGLTNTNYKVETDQGTFVVRISAKDSACSRSTARTSTKTRSPPPRRASARPSSATS